MKLWMISVIGVFLLALCGCEADADVLLNKTVSAADEVVVIEESEEDLASEESTILYAYICGAVENPGVYELAAGSRIYELVELAGGLTEDADAQSVNLADTIEDGEMVWIPTEEESAESAQATASAAATASDGKININTASAAELTALTGIGETKAAAIVSYRESNGSFSSIEEIMQVDGIAEGTYAKIKDDITV